VALRLSYQIVGAETEGIWSSVNKYWSHITSTVSSANPLYLASVEERAIVYCLPDFHKIGV
jgi:hypothetical protein